ncbi:unnamed protein product [Rotaria magnacalcarata]|uniref:BTB domain-containing protein n=5 Tax=Rotaria magnacalcarata TaxID=392030 RepID=A0A816TUB9_9BILA|nr:unnamed protein product [Rotaria magnacalcarata]CAF2100834.1 unnamed protein product [Rotaria magnacalcarata]CAF4025939.1 unnamed protein product [Rotaria magnacalcarata]
MTTIHDNDEPIQQRLTPAEKRQSSMPDAFVIGRPQTEPGRSSNAQQSQRHVSAGIYKPTLEEEHNNALLEHLSSDLGNLLNRVDISDCYLNVRGTYMAVHKCILAARSNAFAAVISGNFNRLPNDEREQLETMTHKDKLVININKAVPEIMKQVIIFMYTGRCELDESNCYALLDAAGRYDIKDLKVHTGRYLSNRINTTNVLMLLKAAYKYDNKLIKQCCIQYFIRNAKEIMDIHELWKRFAEEHREIVAELLHWHVNSDLFYKDKPHWDAVSQW